MGKGSANIPVEKLDDYRWRIPKSYMKGMLVDGLVYADETLMKTIKSDHEFTADSQRSASARHC